MGKTFGELHKMRGIITYRLSPFEQRACAGMITKGLPNVFKRIRDNIFYVGPPLLTGLFVYDQLKKKDAQLMRKNPADYENDE